MHISDSAITDIVRFEKDQLWDLRFMQRVSADLKAWMPEAN